MKKKTNEFYGFDAKIGASPVVETMAKATVRGARRSGLGGHGPNITAPGPKAPEAC